MPLTKMQQKKLKDMRKSTSSVTRITAAGSPYKKITALLKDGRKCSGIYKNATEMKRCNGFLGIDKSIQFEIDSMKKEQAYLESLKF